MPKIATELTDLQVRRLDQPGWHAVGGVAGLEFAQRVSYHLAFQYKPA